MTVAAETPLNTYTANGSTSVFAYQFRIEDESELKIYIDEVEQSSGYSVSGIGSNGGGSVTFTSNPSANSIILFLREMPSSRTIDYQNSGDFLAETVNEDLDRVWLKVQEIERELNYRTLQFPESRQRTASINQLPTPASGQVLVWQADGSLNNALLSSLVSDIEISGTIERYDSVSSFLAASPDSDTVFITSCLSGWAATVSGPKGSMHLHKTGETVSSTSVSGAATSARGIGAQSGYFWDASDVEWRISITEGVLHVDCFGALANDLTSSASANLTAINACIAFAYSITDPFPKVVFNYGVYYVNGEIDRTGTGNYVDLLGMGQRNTIIRATGSSFNSVIRLAESTDVAGRTTVEGLTVDANDIADYCIDAENMRYWTYTNNELLSPVNACILRGNWVTRSRGNRYVGPIGIDLDGRDSNPVAANNFIINDDDFTGCNIGIRCLTRVNECSISNTSFDANYDAAIYFASGVRKLSVGDDCTFERCGEGDTNDPSTLSSSLSAGATSFDVADGSSYPSSGTLTIEKEQMTYTRSGNTFTVTRGAGGTTAAAHDSGVQVLDGAGILVQTGASSYEVARGTIILGYDYSDLPNSVATCNVRDSMFSNCNYEHLIVAYNLRSFEFSDSNQLLESYSYDHILELRGSGHNTSRGSRCAVKGFFPTVASFVNVGDVDDPETDAANLVIDSYEAPATKKSLFYINDPTAASFTGGTTINETDNGGFKEWEFDAIADGSTIDRVFSIDFTSITDHPLLGRYIRIHYETKGVGSTSCVQCRISVSGTQVLDIDANAGTTYNQRGRGATVYIPPTATSFEIRLDALTSSVNAMISRFCVCDAGFEIQDVPVAITA